METRTIQRNPADWSRLKGDLPKQSKIAPVQHRTALPYKAVRALILRIQASGDWRAEQAEACILSGLRTRPVIVMQWGDIDLDDAVWTVPEAFEKSGETLRVPLSPRLLEIIRNQLPADGTPEPDDYVFHRTGGGRVGGKAQDLRRKPIARLARCWRSCASSACRPRRRRSTGSAARCAIGPARKPITSPTYAKRCCRTCSRRGLAATTSGAACSTKHRALMNDWSDVCMGVRPATRTIEQRAA